MPNKDLTPKSESTITLDSEEMELLFMIRMGNYENIIIKTTDGKIERLEASETLNSEKRIIEILNKGKYKKIEIQQFDGKVTHIRRTIKKKLN